MTDREKMIEVMADFDRMQYGTVPNYDLIKKYADRLIAAGFVVVKKDDRPHIRDYDWEDIG